MHVRILPSLLAADMGHLESEALRAEAAGADELHLDIMDGHFVPNISMGPAVVAMARRVVRIPLNVHLMLTYPDRYIERFVKAGANTVQIHIESSCDVPATLDAIRRLGARVGIVLNPDTPAESIDDLLSKVDEVLCMTVQPGYGGQTFMSGVLPKLRRVRELARMRGLPSMDIMVDGGVNGETAARCAEQGANAFVAGTFLFGVADMPQELTRLRNIVRQSLVL